MPAPLRSVKPLAGDVARSGVQWGENVVSPVGRSLRWPEIPLPSKHWRHEYDVQETLRRGGPRRRVRPGPGRRVLGRYRRQ
ncbi:hypothetical protein G6F65_022240 [Rhizopus arrhizus]|nr:hypothetical protein G6F65_022240 [Rhizopus arrhizus]